MCVIFPSKGGENEINDEIVKKVLYRWLKYIFLYILNKKNEGKFKREL